MAVPPGGSETLLELGEPAPTRVTRQKAKAIPEGSPMGNDQESSFQMDEGFMSTDEGSTVRMGLSPRAPSVDMNDVFTEEHEEAMDDEGKFA